MSDNFKIVNLGQKNGYWFQVNLETQPPILIVSDPKTQKQEFVFGKLGKKQNFCFDLKKFIVNTTVEINADKTVFWLKNEKLHREDGPAIVHSDGSKEWWKNGKLHREDGPTKIFPNGRKEWYKNDKLH